MSDLRKGRGKAPVDQKVPCAVCSVMEPLATAHDHHRKPRAFGGTDDEQNRVWLCASCHTRLHRAQEFIMQGKPTSAIELGEALFATKAEARSNLWLLANEAAEAERETQGVFDMHRDVVKVTLSIDAGVWNKLKVVAKESKRPVKDLVMEILKRAAQ